MTATRRGTPICDSARATGWRHRLADPAILVQTPAGRRLLFCDWCCLVGYACNVPYEEPWGAALGLARSTAASGVG